MNPAAGESERDAAEITRASKSNLAFAFITLSRERRRDMEIFYAFCRLVDDIADSTTLALEEKQRGLQRWREAIDEEIANDPPLAKSVREVIARYGISRELFHEIIAGVEMDVTPRRYQTFEDLRAYCYRVASAVGLVSIEIFGCKNPRSQDYSRDLGLALQLTNILRDIAEDYANGERIYLPLEDLAKFNYAPADLAAKKRDERFLALMNFEADRAESFYAKAVAELPQEDGRALAAAEIMRGIYARILKKMRRDGFRVFEKRYRVSALGKLAIIVRVLLRRALSPRSS